jgi:hypothetical protein
MSKDNFTEQGVAPYGMRHGSISPKGKGFFGDLKRPDGDSSTELSSEFEYEGKKVEYPLIVPTLSKAELDILLKGEKPTDDIYDKAESWAKFRINKGMSPFASSTGNEKFPAPEASNKFAGGGMASNDMNRLFAEGGMNDEGGTVDPVSGNDVPAGSLQNEVRDDIDAKLSEGEFVIPADVVRYIGLERLMKLRDEAKQGLSRMAEIGQMGNSQEVENPDALHEDEEGFDSEIDDIMQEVDGEQMGEKKFVDGGFAVPGTDLLNKYNIPKTSITNPALDVRAYKNKEGRVMYITFFNDKPSIAIPAGYEFAGSAGQFIAETKKTDEAKPIVTATETIEAGGDGVSVGGGPSVGGSGVGTGTGIGNSPIGIAIGAIANAISSITNPNAVVNDVPDVSLTANTAIGNTGATTEGLATTAAAISVDDASISEGVSEGNSSNGAPGTVGSTDATAAADNSGNTNSGDGGGGSGSSGGGAGAGTGNAMAKGGLVAKRTKKLTLAQKRGIASKK